MRTRASLIVMVAVTSLLALAWTNEARAALNLACEPPVIRREILPGETIQFSIDVINTGDVACDVTAEVEDLKLTPTGTNIYVPSSERDPWGASSMITVSPGGFRLLPGEVRTVTVKAKAPRDLRGGRYAAIFFKGVQAGARGPIMLAIRPGSLLFLTVKGSERPEAAIGDVYVVRPADATGAASTADAAHAAGSACTLCASLRNVGNVHITVSGKAALFRPTGDAAADIDLVAGGGTVLPGGERIFEGALPEGLPDGEYALVVTFTYAGKTARLRRTLVVSGTFCVVR